MLIERHRSSAQFLAHYIGIDSIFGDIAILHGSSICIVFDTGELGNEG